MNWQCTRTIKECSFGYKTNSFNASVSFAKYHAWFLSSLQHHKKVCQSRAKKTKGCP